MTNLKTARTWGGIGAVLSMFYLTYFLGFILKLLAVREISEHLKDRRIMSDYLWAAMLNIAGNLIMIWAFYDAWAKIHEVIGQPDEIAGIIHTMNWWFFLGALLMLVGAWFLKRSYDSIAARTGVKNFSTAALMYLIGTVFIFFFIGYFIIMLGAVFEVMAFFGLPNEVAPIGSENPGGA